MSLIQKKYRRLLSELIYVESEHKHVESILKEAHVEFEEYYQQYCKDNGVPINELNKKHSQKLKKIFPKNKPQVDKAGIVQHKKAEIKKEKVDKTLQKMYRKAATVTHPDKFSDSEGSEAQSAADTFKNLTSAFNEKKWANFLDICDKLNILPSTYKKVLEVMKLEIQTTKEKTKKLKLSFSWRLMECDDNEKCKSDLIKNFLLQIFGYEKKTIVI
jgi:flagellar basal body rod protein FlgC